MKSDFWPWCFLSELSAFDALLSLSHSGQIVSPCKFCTLAPTYGQSSSHRQVAEQYMQFRTIASIPYSEQCHQWILPNVRFHCEQILGQWLLLLQWLLTSSPFWFSLEHPCMVSKEDMAFVCLYSAYEGDVHSSSLDSQVHQQPVAKQNIMKMNLLYWIIDQQDRGTGTQNWVSQNY